MLISACIDKACQQYCTLPNIQMIQLDQSEFIGHDVRQKLQSASIYWHIKFFVVSNQLRHTVGRLDVCVAKWHSMTSLLGFSNHEVSSYTSQGHTNQSDSTQNHQHCTVPTTAATRTTVRAEHLRLCETSYHMLRRKDDTQPALLTMKCAATAKQPGHTPLLQQIILQTGLPQWEQWLGAALPLRPHRPAPGHCRYPRRAQCLPLRTGQRPSCPQGGKAARLRPLCRHQLRRC